MSGVSIKNLTRRPLVAQNAFSIIAKKVLPQWDISLVFVGSKRAQDLNKNLRNKTYIPNVLSYEVGKKSGEIIICLSEAAKQASDFNLAPLTFHLYLFIHGLLHLKGWAHGVRMERCEQKLLAQFVSGARTHSYVTTNSDRNRHRHLPDKNGSGRGTHR